MWGIWEFLIVGCADMPPPITFQVWLEPPSHPKLHLRGGEGRVTGTKGGEVLPPLHMGGMGKDRVIGREGYWYKEKLKIRVVVLGALT